MCVNEIRRENKRQRERKREKRSIGHWFTGCKEATHYCMRKEAISIRMVGSDKQGFPISPRAAAEARAVCYPDARTQK